MDARPEVSKDVLPRSSRTAWLGCLLAGLGLLVTSCSAPPTTRHFVLTATAPVSEPGGPAEGLHLSVGPVELPAYLDRPQVVTAVGRNERVVDELYRWGEPLRQGFARVLRQNLAQLLPSDQVVPHRGQRGQLGLPDFRLAVDVLRFEITTRDRSAKLLVRWTLHPEFDPPISRRSVFKSAVADDTPEAAVDAMSQTVADLSRALARLIEAHVRASAP